MRLSTKAEYALAAVFDLAAHSDAGPIRIADIARRQKIPQKFLELILAGLKQGGFLESRRGVEGGYQLARPSATLTVGEVLRSVENTGAGTHAGKRAAQEPFREIWSRVDQGVSEVIDQTTFADLVRAWEERLAQGVPNWEI
jgi:Rrf2 family transcriptional regulator, cysteine metabolism repressor